MSEHQEAAVPMGVLRAGELAEVLGVSIATVHRWHRNGRLPAKRRVGPNVTGWLASDIAEWLKGLPPVSSAAVCHGEKTTVTRTAVGGASGARKVPA